MYFLLKFIICIIYKIDLKKRRVGDSKALLAIAYSNRTIKIAV